MNVLLIILLTLLNAAFAMSEMALTASRKPRLSALAEEGDHGAQAALKLLEHPTQFLSTVQVGITSIGILNGIIGEAAFSAGVSEGLQSLGVSGKAAGAAAIALVVTVITFITIIFGELVPKRIGQLYPEQVARWVAQPMIWLAQGARPFVRLLSATTQGVLRLLQVNASPTRNVTEAEISASLEEGVDAGLIEQHEHQMVQNVFNLDERPLTSLMVPRTDLRWLDADLSVAQALHAVTTAGEGQAHSWYPVCRGSLDQVVGIISLVRLLELGAQHPGTIEPLAQAATFVPETLSGMELLEQFRRQARRLVFVVDEYGMVQGLMTPSDLLEAITGELQPQAADDAWATLRPDGSWLLDGLMPLNEIKSRLNLDWLPDEEKGRYNTLAGLLMAVSGHLLAQGERVECAGWVFEVTALDGRRIDKVATVKKPGASISA